MIQRLVLADNFRDRGSTWLWAAIASMAPYGSALISVIALTKTLPPQAYGVWTVTGSTIGLLISLSGAGLDVAAVTKLGDPTSGEARRQFGAALLLSVIAAVLAGMACALLAGPLAALLLGDAAGAIVFVFASIVVPFAAGPRLLSVRLRAQQRFDGFALVIVAEQAATVIGLVAGTVLAGLGGLIVGYVIARTCFGLFAGQRAMSLAMRPTTREVSGLLVAALPLAPLPAFSWVLNLSDRWIVSSIAGTDAVGLYSAGYAVGSFELFLFAPAALVFLPRVVRLWAVDQSAASRYAARTMVLLLVAGTVSACVLALAADPLLRILTTEHYRSASGITAIVSFASMFLGLTTVPGQLLIAQSRGREYTIIYATAAVVNVVSTFGLVAIAGAVGAAWASLASYALLFFAQLAVARRRSARGRALVQGVPPAQRDHGR